MFFNKILINKYFKYLLFYFSNFLNLNNIKNKFNITFLYIFYYELIIKIYFFYIMN